MMKNKCKKVLSIALAAVMMAGTIAFTPIGTSMVQAETDPSATNTAKDINLTAACVKEGDKIYFGKYIEKGTAYHVRWIVLGADILYQTSVDADPSTGEKPSVLPLLSEYAVGWQQFRGDNGNYTDSFLKTRLDNYFNDENNFSNTEKNAVADTTLTAGSIGGLNAKEMSGQKLFPISAEEARKLGFESDILKVKNIIDPDGKYVWWGMRTNWYRNESVAVMNPDGNIQSSGITNGNFIRPACHLDPSSVLFTSANAVDKSSFAEVGSNNVSENSNTWKLTLKDDSKTVKVSNGASVSQINHTVTVPYTYTGDDVSQISIMITDKDYTDSDASILYYGKLDTELDETTKEGTGTFELPDGFSSEYKIYMMAEDVNGDNSTDSSSLPVEIGSSIIEKFEVTVNNGTGDGAYAEGETVNIEAEEAPSGQVFDEWTVVSGDVTLESATSASTTFAMPAGAVEVTATYKDKPAPTYHITDGAKGTWTEGSDATLTFRGDGEFEDFVAVKVDGEDVDPEHYTAKAGSTVITFKPSYLGTLAEGEHTLEMVWTDGSASTTFTVKAAETGDTTTPATGDTTTPATGDTTTPATGDTTTPATGVTITPATGDASSPDTGDTGNLSILLLLMMVCAGSVALISYERKL